MAAVAATIAAGDRAAARRASRRNTATRDPVWVKALVLALALGFFAIFLLLPLFAVFVEALRKGWAVYLAALVEPDACPPSA